MASLCHLWAYSWKDSAHFFFCPLKNCVVGCYLGIELVILQESIGHLSPTKGLFQSHLPGGGRAQSSYEGKSGRATNDSLCRVPSSYRTCADRRKDLHCQYT